MSKEPPSAAPRPGGRHAAILLAGGRAAAQRDGPDVALLSLAGRRLVSRAVAALTGDTGVDHVVVTVHDSDRDDAAESLDREAPGIGYRLCRAGLSAQQSLHDAILTLAPDIRAGRYELVVVHDAARPLAGPRLTRAVIEAARQWGAAVPHVGLDDYIWIDDTGAAQRFSAGANRVDIQTPQAYRARDLLHAYERSAAEGYLAGTAAEAVQRHCGQCVHTVPGDRRNREVRHPADLFAAEELLAELHYAVS